MKPPTLLLVVFACVAACLPVCGADSPLVLVEEGKARAKIYLSKSPRAYEAFVEVETARIEKAVRAEQAGADEKRIKRILKQRLAKARKEWEKVGDEERLAAEEVRDFLEKMSGARLEIEETSDLPTGPAIVIGTDLARAAGFGKEIDGLDKDGLLCTVRDGRLVLAGQRARGTLYAAYTFLESLGCRWVMPGSFGEIVPKLPTVSTAIDVTENPSHTQRYFWCTLGHADDFPRWTLRNKGNFLQAPGDEKPAQSHGLGRPLEWGATHTPRGIRAVRRVLERKAPPGEKPFMAWQYKEIETLPDDYFAMQDGHLLLDTPNMSNPKVWDLYAEYYIDYFNKNPDKTYVSVSAEDGLVIDERPESRLLDAKEMDTTAGTMSATDRLWFFLNRVIEKVVKVHPDKKFGVLVYANNQTPPRLEQVHPNMALVFAPLGISPLHHVRDPKSKTNRLWKEWLEDWMVLARAAGAETYLYDYEPMGFSWNLALICPRWAIIGKNYPWFHEMGLDGHTTQGFDDWASSGFDNYLMQRLYWNASLDYRKVLDDYCAARFGAAAPAMREYYQILEDRMAEIPDLYSNEVWANHLILTPKVRAACRKALEKAEAAADTPQAKAQVETMKALQKSTDAFCDAIEYERDTGDYAGAADRMEPAFAVADELNRIYPNFMNASRMKKDSRRPYETGGLYRQYREIAERIASAQGSVVLPRKWKGQLDTRNHAAAQGLHKPDADVNKLDDLDITVCPDVPYQTQREVAAYFLRTEVDVPKNFFGKKVSLFFPGLIARALQIWVNGTPVTFDSAEFVHTTGRKTFDVDGRLVTAEKEATYTSHVWRGPDFFWMNYDHRREFDLTPYIKPGERNTLAIRIFKSFDFGGSYRRPLLLADAKPSKP